eukprot:480319-Amphidinium_carterae.1
MSVNSCLHLLWHPVKEKPHGTLQVIKAGRTLATEACHPSQPTLQMPFLHWGWSLCRLFEAQATQ